MITTQPIRSLFALVVMLVAATTLSAQGNVPVLPTPDIDPIKAGRVEQLTRLADGRILVGGSFQRLGNLAANGCGRLLPDGSADASFQCGQPGATRFAQDGSGRVYALRTSSGTDTLLRLQADGSVDTSFQATSPGGGGIFAILILDEGIYLGGNFTSINGQARERLARLELDGALDPAWTPSADSSVLHLHAAGDGFLYLGGLFSTISGSPRGGLARLLPVSAMLDSWQPSLTATGSNPVVSAIDSDGSHLYLSGAFSAVQGVPRLRLAKLGLDPAATLDPDWAPEVLSGPTPAGLRLLRIFGDQVYLGESSGGFTLRSGGETVNGRLLRVARGAGALLDTSFAPFQAVPGDGPDSLIAGDGGGRLFVGGRTARLAQGVVRLGLSALNADGSVDGLTALTEAVDVANVAALAHDPVSDSLYLQGDFLKVNGVSRQGLIRLLSSGAVDGGFRPAPARYSAVGFANGSVYAADEDARLLRRLDPLTGDPFPGFVPIAHSNSITAIQAAGEHLYLFGSFVLTGISPQLARFARLNLASSNIDEPFRFSPNSGASVFGIALDPPSNSLFSFGNFSSLNGTAVSRLARIDLSTLAIDDTFVPVISTAPSALLSDGQGGLWLHGTFSTINGQPCIGPARLLIATGGLDPGFSCSRGFIGGNAMALARDSVYVRGINAISRFRRSDGGPPDPDWVVANPPSDARLVAFGDRIYAHGSFSVIAELPRRSVAAFPVVEQFLENGFESP
jgi:hypothetical protein